MSIATEITRLQNDSAAIAAAIAAKGVTVPSGSGFDDYATLVGQISGGQPTPYTSKIEYLQTDGTQFFFMQVDGSEATDAFYVDFQQTTNKNQARIICPIVSSTNAACQLYVNGSGKVAYSFNGSWMGTNTAVGTTRHAVTLDYANKKITVDGEDTTISGSSTKNTGTVCLGAVGKYGSNATFIGKIWRLKMWRSGTLIHDWEPVRVGNIGYMYDNVTGDMIGNAGAGSFTLGPDVS